MIVKHSMRALLMMLLVFRVLMAGDARAAVNDYEVKPGFNLVGVTTSLRTQYVSAFPLLTAWKSALGVTALEAYDQANKVMVRAELDGTGAASGVDFSLNENSALYVFAGAGGIASLGVNPECSTITLKTGFNLVSFYCLPANYTSSDLIASLGASSILSISRFDNTSARWITTAVDGAIIAGEIFNILPGEGYAIYASSDILNWAATLQQLIFNPATLTVRQAQAGATLNLTIPSPAPVGGLTVDLISFSTTTSAAVLTVTSSVIITQGTTSVSIPITPLLSGSLVDEIVEVHASSPNWISGTAVVTIRTKPTVNLSPLTTLTGQGWTYFLTVSLTEPAPTGGFAVTLASDPAGIVSSAATVTIPQGALSTQVTVTALTLGTATITASSPGKALSGDTNTVTVKAIQTIGIGPMMSKPVGILVSTSTPTMLQNSYGPVKSAIVGVTVGSILTGVAPDHGAVGTTDMIVRINGYGLSSATTVTFNPPDGVTILNGTFVAAGDGTYVEAHVAIDSNAPISQRTVIVSTPGGAIMPASPGANIFRVTYQAPELVGINPIRGQVGSTFTMTVSGKNLFSASSIDFTPATGISVNNPPAVSSDGATATLMVVISANTSTGARLVTVTTPAGTTSNTLSAANTFTVTTDAGTTYPSIVSRTVGVLVTSAPTTTMQDATYTPILSLPVGVSVGAVITSVAPVSGSIGASGLQVRVYGSGLFSAISITFTPSTGIITSGSFTVAIDGSYAETVIDIAQNSPLTARTVILGGITALPASPGANQFKVTLPPPEMLAIQPIRGQVGTTFTMTVNGANLTSATSIDFTPAAGISVNNPPAVSSDGTTATATVVISADTTIGDRVVTLTTPGGTTGSEATAANTFTVTTDAGVSYSPIVSMPVGVWVTAATSTTNKFPIYGPVLSLPVGIVVMSAPSATTRDFGYGPVVSQAVGVSVGASVTGVTPKTIEPGTTADIIIHGTGLGQVNTVQVQPPTGVTIGAVTPAGDGLSVTVSITADAGVAVGPKTLIVSASSGTIFAASSGANLLLIGPKPIINSIVPILQVAGTTFTLVVHGTHLQGATEVRVVPSDGIQVSNPPTYYTDGQGEHASVMVVVDIAARGGNRVVIISTPYGSTDSTATVANTLTIDQPNPLYALNLPITGIETQALARDTKAPVPSQEDDAKLDSSMAMLASAAPRRGFDKRLPASAATALAAAYSPPRLSYSAGEIIVDDRRRYFRVTGYRGPPQETFLSSRRSASG